MSKIKAVITDKAPAPIGPYSQGIKAGDYFFASGQVAIDPATGNLIEGDVAAQADQALKNLGEILKAADLTYADVVKTTLFLTNMQDFVAVNEVYANYFDETKPARSTVAVAALPKNAAFEIEAIALRK